MSSYRLLLAYDGTEFWGYAKQPDGRTVQGELERALEHILGSVKTEVAGRTDAGVHARGQVVAAWGERDPEPDQLVRALNNRLPIDVSVRGAERVDPEFSARFDAKWREYHYLIDQNPTPDPLARDRWHFYWTLQDPLLSIVTDMFVGEHDFSALCRSEEGRSPLRTVQVAEWTQLSDGVKQFRIRGTSFCQQQVRSIVAMAVDTARGKITLDEAKGAFEGRDRTMARGAAPARGLTLMRVGY